MAELPENERKLLFINSIKFISAIEFPKDDEEPQIIYLMFMQDELIKQAHYYLQDYEGEGYSLIIEDIGNNKVNLKIYEPHTDDFHITENISIRRNVLENYQKNAKKENTYLSVGFLKVIDGKTKSIFSNQFRIRLKSISFSGLK